MVMRKAIGARKILALAVMIVGIEREKKMRESVNDCVDCGYGNCTGCPMRDREILCCDYCGKELENGYEYKGDVYCASCLLRQLWEDDVINKIS